MKLKLKYTERFVVVFVLVAFIIIAASFTLLLINQKVFEKKHPYKVVFADAVGLSVNTPVYLKGFKIGKISDYILTKENFVLADFLVFDEFKDKIVVNSSLFKSSNPITGGSTIEFLQGPDHNAVLPVTSTIYSIDVPRGKELLAAGMVQKSTDALTSVILNLETFTDNLNRDSIPERGAFFRVLVNLADASEALNSLSTQLDSDITRLNKERGGSLSFYSMMSNLSVISGDLTKTVTLLNKMLVNVDTVLTAYQKPDSLLIKMLDPSGESIYDPLQTTFNNINEVLPRLETFIDFLNAQSTDVTLSLSELRSILKQLNLTVEAINNSPLIGIKKEQKQKTLFPGKQTRIKNFEK